ncbi:DUF397 domain-containing protein [Actinokineospora sp.]|uniref:DUF397 domain-containing protein n=1 Tax=Actinokineospora sp. TaxID=1872133 RepID=UPI00403808B3
MTSPHRPHAPLDLDSAPWRKSSFSGDEGACVETAPLVDGSIAVRNSNHRDAGIVFFTRAEMAAWINGVKAGEFDDLA